MVGMILKSTVFPYVSLCIQSKFPEHFSHAISCRMMKLRMILKSTVSLLSWTLWMVSTVFLFCFFESPLYFSFSLYCLSKCSQENIWNLYHTNNLILCHQVICVQSSVKLFHLVKTMCHTQYCNWFVTHS